MSLFQSYMEVFVSNNPSLLAQGQTVEKLAVGQVAILDAKSYLGVTAPTYANNKALQFVWGTKDKPSGITNALVPNKNIYSKLVKGKKIKAFRGKAARKGQNEVWTLGFSGDVSDTESLTLKQGGKKQVFITLTGSVIDKLYSKQGLTREFIVEDKICYDNCADNCANVDCRKTAEDLVKKVNSDQHLSKFLKASVISLCNPAIVADTTTCYKFELKVCDTKDDVALGLVQSQYPNDSVVRTGVEGALSVYEVIRDANTLPTAFSNAGITLIPDCDVCPTGYTQEVAGYVYTAVVEDANADISATIVTKIDTAHPTANSVVTKLSNDNYVIVSEVLLTTGQIETAIEASAGPAVTSVTFKYQTNRSLCVLTTPTTVVWVANGTLVRYSKVYKLTIGDSVCGVNRLADIQAAYPDLVVTIVNAGGDCVHSYETTVLSNCVETGCAVEEIKFVRPQNFEGAQWVAKATTPLNEGQTCQCGVKFELAAVNRDTNECTYDLWDYNFETVHAQISTFSENYNDKPCDDEWVARKIQQFEYPSGLGSYVRELEKKALSYHLRERSFDAIVREIEGYQFQAKPDVFYDEYVIEFDYDYKTSGGWTEKYTDSYHLHVFFPAGQGKAFETAINSYMASSIISEDGVVL